MQSLYPFLMFEGNAEAAMNLYTGIFENSRIVAATRYGSEGPGKEGTIVHATFQVAGQLLMCIDSAIQHQFTFTPAISLYINCTTEAEIDRIFTELSQGGQVLMPLGEYPFSKKFGWLSDKFGVTWQLNLGEPVSAA